MSRRPTQPTARIGVWSCLLLVACATGPTREERTAQRFERLRAQDTIEGYERFVYDAPGSEFLPEARRRIRELRWEQAGTCIERSRVVLDLPEAPETRAALPGLLDDLLAHRELRCLWWLSEALPEVAADPRVKEALDLSAFDEEVRADLRLLLTETRSLQLAHTARRMRNVHDTRVLPYLIDALRHASGGKDLQNVEVTTFPSGGRAEKLGSKTSAASQVWGAIYWLTGPLDPVRERDDLLLSYAEDDSEAVRSRVREYFDGRNERIIWRLRNTNLRKATDLEYSDFRLNPWVVDDLIACVSAAPLPFSRNYAVLTLGVNRVEKAREAFVAALGDEDPIVRRSAVAALAALGDSAGALLPLLTDPVPGVVATTAEALGLLGDGRATDALLPLLRHTDPHVRSAAAVALGELGWQPRADGERAAWLYAAEDWERFRELPADVRRQALLPEQDAFVAAGCADLVTEQEAAAQRSPEELAAWIARLQEQRPEEYVVAASWAGRDPQVGTDGWSWRDLLQVHRGCHAVRRWPIEWMTCRARYAAERDPERGLMPVLGSRLVDRRLALVRGPDGLRLVPGSEYLAVSLRGDELELLDCDGPVDDVLAPSLERRVRFELERARAADPVMEASVVLLLTHTLTLDAELVVWIVRDCALKEAREQRFAEPSEVYAPRNYLHPTYPFFDADDYRWASGTPRELAEAGAASLEDRYVVRLVTTPSGGTVRDVDAEAVVRLEDEAGETHELAGLIATHLRAGDRLFPGDLVGIAPRE